MAPGPKFSKHERESKMAECSSLYLTGRSQIEIAARLGVTQQQISAYLKVLQQRWQAAAAEALDERKARELARLDRLEREYWIAWERSCQNAQTTVNKAKTTTVDAYTEQGLIAMPALDREWVHTEQGQSGNPRFLEGVGRCIELRLKIVGGFAPAQVEVKDWRDKVIQLLREQRVTPDEVRAEYGDDLATELFVAAGVPIGESGQIGNESQDAQGAGDVAGSDAA